MVQHVLGTKLLLGTLQIKVVKTHETSARSGLSLCLALDDKHDLRRRKPVKKAPMDADMQ